MVQFVILKCEGSTKQIHWFGFECKNGHDSDDECLIIIIIIELKKKLKTNKILKFEMVNFDLWHMTKDGQWEGKEKNVGEKSLISNSHFGWVESRKETKSLPHTHTDI